MPSFRANFAHAKGDIAPKMANICGDSICGDILRLMRPNISSFSAISILFSGHAFLSFNFCPQLPHTAEASITLVPCSTACTRVGSLQKHVMATLPVMLLCTLTYHIQYSLEDAPLPAVTVHEWQQ